MKKDKKFNISILREKFISDYCKKKGWNIKNISPSQLVEIIDNKDFTSPKKV